MMDTLKKLRDEQKIGPKLHSLSFKSLAIPCYLPESTLRYSPTLDLVALVTHPSALEVHRLNGEKVFEVKVAGGGMFDAAEVYAVAWRTDGRIIAVLSSDNSIRLVDVWSGKVVHRLSPGPPSSPAFSIKGQLDYVSWGTNFIRGAPRRTHSDLLETNIIAENQESGKMGQTSNIKVDLPRELTELDVESSLPKMSILPATGADDDIFSTRASVDAIFHSHHRHQHNIFSATPPIQAAQSIDNDPDAVSILLAGSDEGKIYLRIFDSFEIGEIDIAGALPKDSQSVLQHNGWISVKAHANHPRMATHLFLVEAGWAPMGSLPEERKKSMLYLLSLDFGFLGSQVSQDVAPLLPPTGQKGLHFSAAKEIATQSEQNIFHGALMSGPPSHLPILVTKATQLQNLLRYLTQIHSQLAREIQIAYDLPRRWLNNIHEALGESFGAGQSSKMHVETSGAIEAERQKMSTGKEVFQAHIAHLAATGECDPRLREWIVDELSERGLKRWEKAVNEGLENTRRWLEECVLPALERCLVVVSRLTGLAGVNGGVKNSGFAMGLDVAVLGRLVQVLDCMVIVATDALKVVGTESIGFRKWIAWLKWVCEVESCETDERREEVRETGSEDVDWMAILEYTAGGLLGATIPELLSASTKLERDKGKAGWEKWDEARFYEAFKVARRKKQELPGLGDLLEKMSRLCEESFQKIAGTLKRSVLVGYIDRLPDGVDIRVVDMRMLDRPISEQADAVILARSMRNLDSMYAWTLKKEGPGAGSRRKRPSSLDKRRETTHSATDQRWATTWNQTSQIPDGGEILDIKIVDDTRVLVLISRGERRYLYCHPLVISQENQLQDSGDQHWTQLHVFEESSKVSRMAVSRRQGRKAVCVLDSNGRYYQVLDLEAALSAQTTMTPGA